MMNGLLLKFIYFLLLGLTLFISKYGDDKIDCGGIRISAVDDHQILVNTRTYIPLSALSNKLDDLEFHLEKGPEFITIKKSQRGRSELLLDPSRKDLGSHKVVVSVQNGSKYGCVHFMVKVQKIKRKSRVIHCAPEGSGDGSEVNPFGSLSSLLESGFRLYEEDIVFLQSGNHGNVVLSGSGYSIFSTANSTVRLKSLRINSGTNIKISGLNIQNFEGKVSLKEYMVYIDSTSSGIDFFNNKIYSISDTQEWTIDDWKKKAYCGVKCLADDSSIRNNTIQNIFHGIKTEGKNLSVAYNHVDRFGGDAIRNTGSFNKFESNFLTNATVDDYYDEGGNHDDLFQTWTFDKPVVGVSLSDNVMISCLDTIMPNRSKIVQGLVCFDGFEKDWMVTNNLVVTDHPHGIALYGAEACEVYGNTVLRNPHQLYDFESDPWVMINSHKDGRKSFNNEVKGNFAKAYIFVSEKNQTAQNTELDSTYSKLNAYHEWDFRVKK